MRQRKANLFFDGREMGDALTEGRWKKNLPAGSPMFSRRRVCDGRRHPGYFISSTFHYSLLRSQRFLRASGSRVA